MLAALSDYTCTFGPVVIFISTATSFSLASMFSVFFDSTNDEVLPPFTVRNATARFFVDGDDESDDDGFRSDDA